MLPAFPEPSLESSTGNAPTLPPHTARLHAVREALANAARASAADICTIALELVAIPSAHPPGDTHAMADAIARWAGTVPGIEVERHGTLPHVMNLVLRVRGAKAGKRLVFNGHMDTFPLVDAARWTAAPSGELRDGKLFGLGMSDMKGGIAAILFALRHLAQQRDALAGEVVATFVGDEESMGLQGTQYLLDNTPHARGDAMISADTGSLDVLRFGEKGMIWLTLRATGRSAHAAHVHRGDSAIEKLIDVIHALRELRHHRVDAPAVVLDAIDSSTAASEALSGAGESDVLRSVTLTFGTISGGRLSNLVADTAEATVDVRLPIGVSVEDIEQRIVDIVSRHPGVRVEIDRRYAATWTNPGHYVITTVAANVEAVRGRRPAVNMRVGASDARLYRYAGVPTVVCGLTAYNMGAADEHVQVDELRALGEVFVLSAFDFLHDAGPASRWQQAPEAGHESPALAPG